ncbi:hypothetical protein ACJA27_01825 [Mycoplasmopsis lipophila]|uniref:hypothetical protein n=1 Tax=Mycoplasmopsis lipophila TaxID=2117 RepID=UPI0038730336
MSQHTQKKYGFLTTALYFTTLISGVGAAWGLITIKSNPASNKSLKNSYQNLKQAINNGTEFSTKLNKNYKYFNNQSKPNLAINIWEGANIQHKNVNLEKLFLEYRAEMETKLSEIKSSIKSKSFQESDLQKWTLDLEGLEKTIKQKLEEKIVMLEEIAKICSELATNSAEYNDNSSISTTLKEKMVPWFKNNVQNKLLENDQNLKSITSEELKTILSDVKKQNELFKYYKYASNLNVLLNADPVLNANNLEQKIDGYIEKSNKDNSAWKNFKNQLATLKNQLADAKNKAKTDIELIDSTSNINKLSKINIKETSGNETSYDYSSSYDLLKNVMRDIQKSLLELEQKVANYEK